VEVDGENLSTLPTDKLDNKAYYAFDWDPSVNDGILWSDSRQWRQITDVCWTNWVTQQGWYDLCDGVSTTIIQSRKRGILANWNNIHIAAAKFENTQMCHWMRSLDVKWEVVNEFVAHTIKANITSPANVMLTKKKNDIDTYSDWRWSKNQFQNKPEILEKYHNFIDSSKLTEWIAIRNNTDADRKVDRPASRHQREVRVSHYVSGMNKYRHISAISLETSTRPSRDMNDWFKQVYEVTDTQIQQMTEGYRNYQVVMRTKVRDDSNAIIDIWAIDNAFIWMLNDYIDFDIKYTPKHLTQIDLIDIGQISRGGRPSKYLSDEERREAKKKADRLRIAELRAKNKKCKK
jgi:hypothetical protein